MTHVKIITGVSFWESSSKELQKDTYNHSLTEDDKPNQTSIAFIYSR